MCFKNPHFLKNPKKLKILLKKSFKSGLNQIPLNHIKSDGCEGAVAKATKWYFMNSGF